jgi:anti-sigma factor RsiW
MSPEPDTCLMRCRELVELVTDYLEGVLPGVERARFEGHIATCGHCAAYVEQMRVTLTVVGRIDPGTLDPVAEATLLDAFRGWKSGDGA